MKKESKKIINEIYLNLGKIINKFNCSSCGSSEFEENFTLDHEYNFDVCDKCFKANEGK